MIGIILTTTITIMEKMIKMKMLRDKNWCKMPRGLEINICFGVWCGLESGY